MSGDATDDDAIGQRPDRGHDQRDGQLDGQPDGQTGDPGSPAARGIVAIALLYEAPHAGCGPAGRLSPPLARGEVVELARCFVADIADTVASLPDALGTQGVLLYPDDHARGAFAGLPPEAFEVLPQRGEQSRERMVNAIDDLLGRGYAGVCLLNPWCPALSPALLTAAVDTLRSGTGVVVGPAGDGRCYLIGLSRHHPELFDGLAWETPRLIAQLEERSRQSGVAVARLAACAGVTDPLALAVLCHELLNDSSSSAAPPALSGGLAEGGPVPGGPAEGGARMARTRAYLAQLRDRGDGPPAGCLPSL